MIERQKYKDITLDEVPSNMTHYQPKYDGIWCCAITEEGHTKYYSRTGNIKQEEFTNTPDGVYIGELMYGSEWAQDPERKGKFYVFDQILDEFDRRAYKTRLNHLGELERLLPSHWMKAPTYAVGTVDFFWRDYVETQQVEGVVFRDMSAPWETTLYRCKFQIEIDLVVVGIEEGKGKHKGSMGALVVRRIDSEGIPTGDDMNVGGGYDDATRRNVWAAWPHHAGKIMTVNAKKIFASGKLRHPNFVRWHLEK